MCLTNLQMLDVSVSTHFLKIIIKFKKGILRGLETKASREKI